MDPDELVPAVAYVEEVRAVVEARGLLVLGPAAIVQSERIARARFPFWIARVAYVSMAPGYDAFDRALGTILSTDGALDALRALIRGGSDLETYLCSIEAIDE